MTVLLAAEASDHTTLTVAIATLLVAVAQWITAHRKGRARDRHGAARDDQLGARLHTLETKVDRVLEQHDEFDERITTVEHHVSGPSGDNGLRSKSADHETRIRSLERLRGLGPADVGTLSPRGG